MDRPDEINRFSLDLDSDVWRIALKRYGPLETPPKSAQGRGRFDDPIRNRNEDDDGYGVLYCASTPKAAFLEVLATYRAKLGAVSELISDAILSVEERDQAAGMNQYSGVVPADWRESVHLVHGNVSSDLPLFNLVDSAAVQWLRAQHEVSLVAMGLSDLDFSHVLSDNRELTRAISRWIWSMTTDDGEPLFSGIRYRSRFDPECICIALYQDRFQVEGDILSQPITARTPGFADAASTLRLTISKSRYPFPTQPVTRNRGTYRGAGSCIGLRTGCTRTCQTSMNMITSGSMNPV